MNKNKIEDYVLKAESVLPSKLCKDLIKDLNKDKKNWTTHKWHSRSTGNYEYKSGKKELFNCYLGNDHSGEVMKILWTVIASYIKKFNYKWFDSWTGYSPVRFNIYKKGKTMADHCDHIGTLFDGPRKGIPILSVLGTLNTDYEGGEFIMFGNKKYKLKQGDILVFPSNFLYPHRVDPVTKGTRYSYISWVW